MKTHYIRMTQKRNHWLLKSEPSTYSIHDFKKERKTGWTGVRNYQARNFMRESMKVDDYILFYHSNTSTPEIAGVGKVVSKPYPDSTQFDRTSEYYDPKATLEHPRWFLVDVSFKEEFKKRVLLKNIKTLKIFSDMPLLKKGNRLSIQPVSKKHFDTIIKMSRE